MGHQVRGPGRGALAAVGGVLLLAACAGGAAPEAPAEADTAAVVAVTGTTELHQTQEPECDGGPLPLSGHPCATQRGEVFAAESAMSDPRVSGLARIVVDCDVTESATEDGGWAVVADCRCTNVITNDGGTWEGTCTAVSRWTSDAPIHLHDVDMTFLGTGDYQGLRYDSHVVNGGNGPWAVTGEIGPATASG